MLLDWALSTAREDGREQVLGSSATLATRDLLTAIASAIANAERLRGTTWLQDASLRRRCNEVVKTLADIMMPDNIGDDRIEEIIADHVFELRNLQDEEMYAFVKQMTETHGLEMPKDVVVEKDGKETINIRKLIAWATDLTIPM